MKSQKLSEGWESFYSFLDSRLSGVSTGINALDRVMLGLRGITGISGSPGTNKSTLALQIAAHYAQNHGPVLFYDRENGINRLRLRLLCQYMNKSEIDISLLKKSSPSLLKSGEEFVKALPFTVILASDFLELRELVSGLIGKGQKPLLIIDSIQKLQHDLNDRRASIDSWLCNIDSMKVEFEQNLKTILVIEKSYSGYEKHDLGGSKDSSEIEYTVESMLNLRHHPENNKRVVCRIAKDRDGVRGCDIELELQFADPANERSFTYKLGEVKEEDW